METYQSQHYIEQTKEVDREKKFCVGMVRFQEMTDIQYTEFVCIQSIHVYTIRCIKKVMRH
jgi:hypothetical protein